MFRVQRVIFNFLACFSCLHFELLCSLYYKKKLYRFIALLVLEDIFVIINNYFLKKLFCKELFKMVSLNILINIKVSFTTLVVEKSKYKVLQNLVLSFEIIKPKCIRSVLKDVSKSNISSDIFILNCESLAAD